MVHYSQACAAELEHTHGQEAMIGNETTNLIAAHEAEVLSDALRQQELEAAMAGVVFSK